jgi:paraquat-inducible protein A
MSESTSPSRLIALLYLNFLLFIVGISSPVIIISIDDPLTQLLGAGIPSLKPSTERISIIQSIVKFWSDSEKLLAIVIFSFSIIFPVIKIVLPLKLLRDQEDLTGKDLKNNSYLPVLGALGKWSMLDVFIVAVIVVTLKQFPGGVNVTTGLGIWVFSISVLLSSYCNKITLRFLEVNDTHIQS